MARLPRVPWLFAGAAAALVVRVGPAAAAEDAIEPAGSIAPPAPAAGGPSGGDARARALAEELHAAEVVEFHGTDAYLGSTRILLEGPAFYEAVGRPDLAARYRDRASLKTASRVIGAVALGAGVLWGIIDVAANTAASTLAIVPCLGSSRSSSPAGDGDLCGPHEASDVPWGVAAVGVGGQ